MYEEYLGQYDKEYWIRRVKRLIIQYNHISSNKLDYKSVVHSCRENTELFCIEQYFKYREIYLKRYKQFIEETK